MAEELIQDQLSQTRRVGEMVSISCGGTDGCDKKHVYWYQKTKTGPFTVILRIDLTDGKFNSRYNHPQQKDFSALRKEYGCDLMISSITLLHSATYYCICWKSVAHRADGRSEDPLETTRPSSDLTARPCLASAASERHFSPGSPEETPLHTMLFLPAAALCCLCSALVAMAAELIQEDLTWTRRVDETVSFSCRGTDQCDRDNVYWYQMKDTETFTRILFIYRRKGRFYPDDNHPQKDDFSALRKQNVCELVITKIKLLHLATYYCSCWKEVSTVRNDPCSLNKNQQMSNSVCDRKRAVNHSPGSHISPPKAIQHISCLYIIYI
ncbi:uncharacterized protein LOC123964147 [Micropterus dolomieu]|uniref:uncharacterized protein LOC123964147 n=1 Tax=Micropterus dolomieu TaxID=147949 RepID=UPI001E8CED47|nr:uncharacterized protein LOC123964147 [Micropterus dolomieu]